MYKLPYYREKLCDIFFNLANWQLIAILFHALSHNAEALAITKFKIRQCILMTGLMLAKVSPHRAFLNIIPCRTTTKLQ